MLVGGKKPVPEAMGNSTDEKMDTESTNGVELCRVFLEENALSFLDFMIRISDENDFITSDSLNSQGSFLETTKRKIILSKLKNEDKQELEKLSTANLILFYEDHINEDLENKALKVYQKPLSHDVLNSL